MPFLLALGPDIVTGFELADAAGLLAGLRADKTADEMACLQVATTLAEAGLGLWPDWAAAIEERTGVGVRFRRDGLLNLWVDPENPPARACVKADLARPELLVEIMVTAAK